MREPELYLAMATVYVATQQATLRYPITDRCYSPKKFNYDCKKGSRATPCNEYETNTLIHNAGWSMPGAVDLAPSGTGHLDHPKPPASPHMCTSNVDDDMAPL